MEHSLPILPSNDPSPQHLHSLDDSGFSHDRQPHCDNAGNSLVSIDLYHDSKVPPRVERSMNQYPTIPLQPPRQTLGSTLEHRRHRPPSHKRQYVKYTRNPIVDSPQYIAYRSRQNRDSNPDDLKWPSVLEEAFLDALLDIPKMGRRKFSFRGKPHGRNELIKEYLWIAYQQSLPLGQQPDESMKRTRKQVSSHIQVLKGFMKPHRDFHHLFPDKKGPKNGFEDSFKGDPCLTALSHGRLPTRKYEQYGNATRMAANQHPSIRPSLFWLLMTLNPTVDDGNLCYSGDRDVQRRGIVEVHRYTTLSPRGKRSEKLESITDWRQKFPSLERSFNSGQPSCDIIHMDVSLQLMRGHHPEGAELVARTEISISGRELENCDWQTVTTLLRPPELVRDPSVDPYLEAKVISAVIPSAGEDETRIKIPFPVSAWAHTFTCLADLQLRHEYSHHSYGDMEVAGRPRSARYYVEQMSMYQEVQSCSGPGMPFICQAVILWTFRKSSRPDEGGSTSWRYVDASPPRDSCMSPSPHTSHHISANMNENFNSFMHNPMHLQHSNMLDSFVHGLTTPPNTAGFQSPFNAQGYAYPNQYEIPSENVSFASTATLDSESTLVESDTATNIDNFLSQSTVNLGDYDGHSAWNLDHHETFDTDPAWSNYTTVPSSTPQLAWGPEVKDGHWPETDPKQTWLHDMNGKHDWAGTGPTGQDQTYPNQIIDHISQIDDKLLAWTEHPTTEVKNTYAEGNNMTLPELTAGPIDSRDQTWIGSDSAYDYSQLERLKQC